MQLIQLSEATASLRRIFFQAVDATDGITAETGLTGAGRLSKAGAATAATTNNITEIDATNMPGRYYIELTATEVNTLGIVEFRFKTAACAEVVARAQVVAFDPFTATDLGITRLDAAVSSRSSHSAADVWAAGTRTLTSFGSLVSDIWSAATRTLTAFGFSVTVGTNSDKTGYALTSAEHTNIADALLKRDWTAVTGEAARSVLNALRFLRNKWSVASGTLTVTKEDDTTSAWTGTVTTDSGAEPVTGVDP